MSQYIMSIDQGTTSSRVILLNSQGQLVAQAGQEFEQIYPKPGWVEHRPKDIWKTVIHSISECLKTAKVSGDQIAAIGITNQRETAVMWDKETGEAPHNAIVWQCRRTAQICEKLRKAKKQTQIKNLTGLIIDPYFSSTKFQWMLQNSKAVASLHKKKRLLAGTIDSFLIWNLTGGKSFKTDVTNASRTQLMNIKTLKWDQKLLDLFGLDQNLFAEIVPSSSDFGQTYGLKVLPDGIPIMGVAGDQQAALFGQACFSPGEAKCTYGTGSFVLLNTGEKLVKSKTGMLTTLAWQLDGKAPVYALEGSVFICGAAVQWLRDGLKIIEKSGEVEELARTVSSTEGVEFVPALTGLGAPHWLPEARGMITGLTRGSSRAHVARATLEAMALQNVDVLLAMASDFKQKLKTLKVDGGASQNDLLMQMQSDYLGVKIQRPQYVETTALGAAYLAGLKAGIWKSPKDIQKIWKKDKSFAPKIKPSERKLRLGQWHQAISKLK